MWQKVRSDSAVESVSWWSLRFPNKYCLRQSEACSIIHKLWLYRVPSPWLWTIPKSYPPFVFHCSSSCLTPYLPVNKGQQRITFTTRDILGTSIFLHQSTLYRWCDQYPDCRLYSHTFSGIEFRQDQPGIPGHWGKKPVPEGIWTYDHLAGIVIRASDFQITPSLR